MFTRQFNNTHEGRGRDETRTRLCELVYRWTCVSLTKEKAMMWTEGLTDVTVSTLPPLEAHLYDVCVRLISLNVMHVRSTNHLGSHAPHQRAHRTNTKHMLKWIIILKQWNIQTQKLNSYSHLDLYVFYLFSHHAYHAQCILRHEAKHLTNSRIN